MKEKSTLFYICLLCAAMLPVALQGQFLFTTNNDGSLNILAYEGSGGTVIIPTTTNGLPITSIGDFAFEEGNMHKLTSVTISDSIATIGYQSFSGCSILTNVIFGNSVTDIGYESFQGCTGLKNISIPNSVTGIGGYTFLGCIGLTNITLGDGVSDIESAFYGCTALKTITIPNSVTSIGVYSFYGCSSLASITIPNRVTTIGQSAFQNCISLTNACIGTNVTSIGFGAFYECTSLTSITIPNSVTIIGEAAFLGCARMTNALIGNGVTNIGVSAFYCTNLIAITVDTNNPAYCDVGGVLFDKNQTTLIECPGVGKIGSYTIPDTVTNILASAFALCTSLTGIIVGSNNAAYCSSDDVLLNKSQTAIIVYPQSKDGSYIVPNTVTNIGDWAFMACIALTSVIIPDGISGIGSNAFYSCTSLTNAVLGNGITRIGYLDFQYCTGLKHITIPSSVTNLDNFVFEYCTNLMAVYFLGNAPTVGSSVFLNPPTGKSYNPIIYYLPGTTGWSVFSGGPGFSTKLWIPQMQISAFGVQTNQFGFTTTVGVGLTKIVVQACTNLSKPVWQSVSTNTLPTGSGYFSDPQWTNYPGRFYRIRSP